MKQTAARLLQAVLALVAGAVFVFMLWEPHLEGRNDGATVFQIYFQDPFLAYAYVASIPFFAALWQGFRFWGFAARGQQASPQALKALRTGRLCALAMIPFIIGGEVWIFIVSAQSGDDRAPAVFLGGLITLAAVLMATAATVAERIVRRNAPPLQPA